MARQPKPLFPEPVREAVASGFKTAIDIAVSRFDYSAAKEDGLSAALIERLVDEVDGSKGDWSWKVRPLLVSSNMRAGGEGVLGADFVLQVDVFEGGLNTAHKIIPVQAKKLWSGRDVLLGEEASKLAAFPGSGIVVDYDPRGYMAVPAELAAMADGDRRLIADSDFRGLADVLGTDFLLCRIGTRKGYMNKWGTEVHMADGRQIPIRTEHVARLFVSSKRPAPRRTPPSK